VDDGKGDGAKIERLKKHFKERPEQDKRVEPLFGDRKRKG
jgi:hypothetical protein